MIGIFALFMEFLIVEGGSDIKAGALIYDELFVITFSFST